MDMLFDGLVITFWVTVITVIIVGWTYNTVAVIYNLNNGEYDSKIEVIKDILLPGRKIFMNIINNFRELK